MFVGNGVSKQESRFRVSGFVVVVHAVVSMFSNISRDVAFPIVLVIGNYKLPFRLVFFLL
jgi:hypothetical protein